MNSFYLKNLYKASALKQFILCNNNQVMYQHTSTGYPEPFLKCKALSHPTSIFKKLQQSGVICISKKFHTFSILKNESPSKVVEGNKKLGLAEELLSSTLKSNPVEDEQTKKQKEEEKERTMRALKFTYITVGGLTIMFAGLTLFAWGVPQHDENGNILEDEFSSMPILPQYVCRTYKEMKSMNRMIQEPSSDKLLPDALSAPFFQPPYTLVLELTDLLVHPEWTYQSGWRFKKRPGVDFLLQHCCPPLFEVVVYTNEQAFTAHPVVEQLDQNNIIWYRIYKDGTRYENGKHYKDLYCLNRDLNKVIAIDWNKGASTSPRNTLNIKRWSGDMADNSLMELAVMIRTIAESHVGDVREVIAYYNTFDDPVSKFKENSRLALERETEEKEKKPKSFINTITNYKKN